MALEPVFVHFDDVRPFALADGVVGRPLFGAGSMLNMIEFEPGAVVPLHSHPHEQLGLVLRGMQALVVNGRGARSYGPMEGATCCREGSSTRRTAGRTAGARPGYVRPGREDYRDRWESGSE